MKKNLIAVIAAIFISVPSLFAFHDLATDHLVPGMPVVFIATGPKFPPAMHDAVTHLANAAQVAAGLAHGEIVKHSICGLTWLAA